jgi:hypothetical protein
MTRERSREDSENEESDELRESEGKRVTEARERSEKECEGRYSSILILLRRI